MEPISTILLLASLTLPATAIPNWAGPKKTAVKTSISQPYLENGLSIQTFVVPAKLREVPISAQKTSDTVFDQLATFQKLSPGWDGPESLAPSPEDLSAAEAFIQSIPVIFPLPKAMLSADGIVGLYWDDGIVYLDIQIDSPNSLSSFSRDRVSGQDQFSGDIPISDTNATWYFNNLGILLNPSGYLVAA